MTEVERIVKAIAIVESGDNPNAPLGDDGRALGRWQVHSDWFDEWRARNSTPANPDEMWDSWVGRVVTNFVALWSFNGTKALLIAMHFHLGHPSDPSKPDWDAAYAARFQKAYDSLA